MDSMDALRAEDQIGERRRVDRFDFRESPIVRKIVHLLSSVSPDEYEPDCEEREKDRDQYSNHDR